MADSRDTAIRDDNPHTEIANLRLEVASLREQVAYQIKGRREMRAAILRIYENIDPASVSHLDAEKALNGWHRRLHEILADDLRSW